MIVATCRSQIAAYLISFELKLRVAKPHVELIIGDSALPCFHLEGSPIGERDDCSCSWVPDRLAEGFLGIGCNMIVFLSPDEEDKVFGVVDIIVYVCFV